MSIYWTIFILPILFGISKIKVDNNIKNLLFFIFGLILVVIIGFRHEIGGDWARYISIYEFHTGTELDFSNFKSGDYAYELIVWFSNNYLNGIYSTNFICSIFFVAGLFRFCRAMPMPWVALFVSIPFLVIIVSMGYTRQGTAVGVILWGLVDLMKGNTGRYYMYIVIAVLFHKTALIMLPIGVLYKIDSKSILIFIAIFVFFVIFVYGIFKESFEHMFYFYVTIEYKHSQGAILRTFMTFLSSMIFLIFGRKYREKFDDYKLWFIFSIIGLAKFPAAYFYSMVADRFAVYFLGIQLVALSRVPVLIESIYNRTIFVIGAAVIYAASLFVWLIFGKHASFWLPYQNILFLTQ